MAVKIGALRKLISQKGARVGALVVAIVMAVTMIS